MPSDFLSTEKHYNVHHVIQYTASQAPKDLTSSKPLTRLGRGITSMTRWLHLHCITSTILNGRWLPKATLMLNDRHGVQFAMLHPILHGRLIVERN